MSNPAISFIATLIFLVAAPGAFAADDESSIAKEIRKKGYATELPVWTSEYDSKKGALGQDSTAPSPRERIKLSNPEGDTAEAPNAMSRLEKRFAEWLENVLGRISPFIAEGLYVIIAIAAVIFILTLLWLYAKRPRQSTATISQPAQTRVLPHDPLLDVPTRSSAELAREGLFKEALHALFVETLQSQGLLQGAVGRTAREIISAQKTDAQSTIFLTFLELVECHWFGPKFATAETFANALSLQAHIKARL